MTYKGKGNKYTATVWVCSQSQAVVHLNGGKYPINGCKDLAVPIIREKDKYVLDFRNANYLPSGLDIEDIKNRLEIIKEGSFEGEWERRDKQRAALDTLVKVVSPKIKKDIGKRRFYREVGIIFYYDAGIRVHKRHEIPLPQNICVKDPNLSEVPSQR